MTLAAFHLGDEQHDEFSIQAYTKDREWAVSACDFSQPLQRY